MNVFITGASNGIGYETALQFCKRGNTKVIALSRNKEKLEKLKAESNQYPTSELLPLAADLEILDEKNLSGFLNENKIKSINVLINNAGLLIKKPFYQLEAGDWQKVYSVNVFSMVRLIQVLLPVMERKERSHVLNISSMGGVQGSSKFAGLSAYSSSKAAVINLTECLAEELKDENIAFNCLALGAVQTEMLNEAFPGYKAPLQPAEMASWIVDFAVKGQQFFNGKTLPVSMSTP